MRIVDRSAVIALALTLALAAAVSATAAQEPFSWQQAQAVVDERGDLQWRPQPFRFVAGSSQRYVDYEGGDDAADGTTPASAWRHHPWDAAATGRAAATTGIHTYVFKGGSTYRGSLRVRDAGRAEEPIRLTRDPAWGEGPAIIAGSERVVGWQQGAGHPDIPEAQQVWWADLDFAPRTLWMVAGDGEARRIPLARTPNWTAEDPDDIKAGWWRWDNPDRTHGNTLDGKHLGIDTVHLRDRPADYYLGATIWSEFGWVMGGPYPTEVVAVDLERHGLAFDGWTGGGTSGVIYRNMRYYLEDKPHYLDDPSGEFWFDRRGAGGRLYLRLAAGQDPNRLRLEAGKRRDLIVGNAVEHLEISGLDFRWTGPAWDLTIVPWDFSTRPWGLREDANPACIRIWGEGHGIRIANCRFRDVVMPIRLQALRGEQTIDAVLVEDNEFEQTDEGVLRIAGGVGWGYAQRPGRLGDVRVLRNRSRETGMRPSRYGNGTAIDVGGARTLEIAGNVVERSGAQGINVVGGKSSGMWGDVPFTRSLIHHNKVWQSMLWCNDYGGIEVWGGGPFYIYDNLSHDARGMWYGHLQTNGRSPGFGHAYYLDGAYKGYLFNNIAWGRSNDPTSILVNCSAFQEIHGFLNSYVNNTAYNYYVGSRRQAPGPGRNKYLGNVWSAMSERAFRHADPAKTAAEGNAHHVGEQGGHIAVETNAYAGNVFHDVAQIGVFEASGRWLASLEDFREALAAKSALVAQLGTMAEAPPLRDPAAGDFRPAPDSPVLDRGVRVFVPWALSGVVGEWHGYHVGGDPTSLPDEHWYLRDFYTERTAYHEMPSYPLRAVNVTAEDYVAGPLEDWIAGALRFDPARAQYAVLANADLEAPITVEARLKSRHEGAQPERVTIAGEDLRSPQIHDSDLLIEVYARIEPGASGLIVGKRREAGYELRVDAAGRAVFVLAGQDGSHASLLGAGVVADGAWHHLLVEADRSARILRIHLDGRQDAEGEGLGRVSLANAGDLLVGGSPGGGHLAMTLDFLRIARGTLAAAQTTIEELHAWQFDGPQLRDFTGIRPVGAGRDAGAIEARVADPAPDR